MKIVYLQPLSSFTRTLRSDTLWGLLCWGIRNVYGNAAVEDFIAMHTKGDEVVKVSSAFPFIKETETGTTELFFPKPLLPSFNWELISEGKSKTEKLELYAQLKSFKKEKELDKTTFEAVINGEMSDLDLFNRFAEKETLSQNGKKEKPFKNESVMHNQIDRLTGTVVEGALFVKEEIFCIENGGLFFLLQSPPDVFPLIEASLRFLSHSGFGGDSSVGKNHFLPQINDFSLRLPDKDAKNFVTLSLYTPLPEELRTFTASPDNCFYEILTRKGKAGGKFLQLEDFWKPSRLSFSEGSVFPHYKDHNYGSVSKVLDAGVRDIPFNVYRSGIAFNLPVNLKESK